MKNYFKGSVSSVSSYNFGKQIRHVFQTDFVTLTNDVAVLSHVADITSVDLTLDTGE